MVELLAPAGNFISLRAVLENGADAVYFGLDDFNMRANAKNFSLEELGEVSLIAQEYGAKTYLGTNIILNERLASELESNMETIASSEIDGLILSDIGLIEDTVSHGLEAHISVQENVTNSYTLKTLKKLGAKRAILSRELSLAEVTEITRKSPIETEIFVHGAICMAISGRCFLSYGLYGRSANCGDCLQPCRKNWTLTYEEGEDNVINFSDVEDERFIITGSDDGSYRTNFFSPKDMCMIEYIPELMESGVASFKIEGRARSPDYGAMVTGIYRQAIDDYEKDSLSYKVRDEWMDELTSVFNRGFDTNFYFNTPFEKSEDNQSKYIKKDIGQVVNYYNKVKAAELRIWDDLSVGDRIIIQGKTTGSITHTIDSMQIEGKSVDSVEKGCNVAIAMPEKVRENDFVYKLVERDIDD
ncbi:peptidase U32 family protein [Methanobrevibacter sp. UBA212]|uniref:peptidase U32 family protein n=1 Tax=Methanobrevibacter sp. UBA212 TaxID=1915476 RepID=UPI0025F730F8|nr:peptidase U32 family protein [Methanobrevibacter sp. UBA212]MEE1150939.1 peptidase U32 family protein [Methanobrevibacter sp.]